MGKVVTAGLLFTAAGTLLIAIGIPLLRGRVRPNLGTVAGRKRPCRTRKVWYAAGRVTGRDLVAAGVTVVACSLALLVFGRGMSPTYAVLALPFVLLLSVVIMAADSHGAQKRM